MAINYIFLFTSLEFLGVQVLSLNPEAIGIRWVVPAAISQGFQSVVATIQSECFTRDSLTLPPPRDFTITDMQTTNVIVDSLGRSSVHLLSLFAIDQGCIQQYYELVRTTCGVYDNDKS